MKNTITLNTLAGNAISLTVEAYNGMIHLSTVINGTEYFFLRLPQELKQWPINGTLCMDENSGNDFGGRLIAKLDSESSERLDAILAEAAQRVNDAREYEDSMSEEEARELMAQLRAEIEADTAPYEPDPDFSLFDD